METDNTKNPTEVYSLAGEIRIKREARAPERSLCPSSFCTDERPSAPPSCPVLSELALRFCRELQQRRRRSSAMINPRTVPPSSGHTDVTVEAPPGWAEDQQWSLVISVSFVKERIWLVPASGPP